VLIEAARAAARTKNTYLGAQYRRLAARRGPNKASVAVAHSMIVSAWHMLSTGGRAGSEPRRAGAVGPGDAAGVEQHAEPVVIEAAEPAAGPLDPSSRTG
jgi:hypothetical protein